MSFSPGRPSVLTTESGGPARIWDAAAGSALDSLGGTPTAASFSPDGSLVLTVEPNGARVWQATDGSPVAALRQPSAVRMATFGPEGTSSPRSALDSIDAGLRCAKRAICWPPSSMEAR